MKQGNKLRYFVIEVIKVCLFFSIVLYVKQLLTSFNDLNKATHKKPIHHSLVTYTKVIQTTSVPPKTDLIKKLNILSIDWHISPIADLKLIASMFFPSVEIFDYSLSGACHSVHTCAGEKLKVLTPDVSHSLYLNLDTKIKFYEVYKQEENSLMQNMHAMICSHPSGMCELAMPFNKTVILWITTRFEQGRENEVEKFKGLVTNFRILNQRSGMFLAANNWYDVHYFNYFTGMNAQYIPSFCNYTNTKYSWNGKQNTILIHGFRPKKNQLSLESFMGNLNELKPKFSFATTKNIYPGRYEYKDLATHPAILHIPYQVSIMSFFEQYRMCIPIISPSLPLLTKWHMQFRMVSERTWSLALNGMDSTGSILPKHPDANPLLSHDPNDDQNIEAVEFWLQFADYYKFPHIILFDSWEDLNQKLEVIDFHEISKQMCLFNNKQLLEIQQSWQHIFSKINVKKENAVPNSYSYSSSMNFIYGENNWAAY